MRTLVVEDDAGIAAGIRVNLQRQGWAVDIVGTVQAAWVALAAESYHVVLLDLGLPDGDGTDLLRRLRAARANGRPDPATPVLIMTARDDVSARISGLDSGADDYVSKPFDVDELAARLRALRRRAAGRAQATLDWGDLHIDPAARAVLQGGTQVQLSAREFDVLLALMEARPRVLSKPQIEGRLYNWESVLDSNAIEVHVHHLRRKLGDGVIRTVRGVGYFVPAEPTA
jgi:two-component system OmpR family response regulator/two-component system response regulator QseB